MCTLIVLDRVVPGYPLVVASNRDEFYSRPAAPPARVDPEEGENPPYVAPQDLKGGGAWMGVNAQGLFVGLTNRAVGKRREDVRSRGLLVTEALGRQAAVEVAGLAQEAGESLVERYNPFHLLAADGRQTFLTVVTEQTARTEALEPGLHVICNRDPDDPSSAKVGAIRRAVGAIDTERPVAALFASLAEVLASHPDASNPLENPCVHTLEYGTRSSTVLAIGEPRWRYWHAEGAPCEAKYANFTRLLDDLRKASSARIT